MFKNLYSIFMYKKDLALNNLQLLICHKTQPNQTKSYIFNIYMYKKDLGKGGARGVMVIIVGNGYGDTSSNPRQD